MRRGAIVTCAAAVFAAFAAAASSAPAQPSHAASATPYERALLADVNAVRAAHGVPPLRLSRALTRAAMSHSTEMARLGYFDHSSANGTSFDNRIARFYPTRGWRYWSVGEDLVSGSPELGPGLAIETWLQSPAHRRTLLARGWRKVGIAAVHVDASPGVYAGQPAMIVTADFGVRR